VANQTQREAVKFGYTAKVVAEESEIDGPGIYITNYDKLDHFDNVEFGGVVLDESSILKNFKGSTRIALTKRFEATQFRLCCTATPSPNDYTEFGQHADFLGICSPSQMLATYFINDTFNTGDWRLKKHAENVFWEWVSSWAACISKPSDIGFDDEGYNLPALNLNTIIVDVDEVSGRKEGELIRFADLSATTMHQELRMTAQDRVNAVADLANNSDESWLVWCNSNTESEMLTKAIPDAVEVRGCWLCERVPRPRPNGQMRVRYPRCRGGVVVFWSCCFYCGGIEPPVSGLCKRQSHRQAFCGINSVSPFRSSLLNIIAKPNVFNAVAVSDLDFIYNCDHFDFIGDLLASA